MRQSRAGVCVPPPRRAVAGGGRLLGAAKTCGDFAIAPQRSYADGRILQAVSTNASSS